MHRLALAAALALAAPAHAQDAAGERFVSVWDLDRDGAVALDEMQRMRGNVFGRFDANGDEVLDGTEYAAFDAARAADIADFEAEADRAAMTRIAGGLSLPANDADGDGVVSRAELAAGATAWLADLDRNGDGAVTAADFVAD